MNLEYLYYFIWFFSLLSLVRQVLANDNYNGQAGTMMALGTLNPPPAAMSSVIQQQPHQHQQTMLGQLISECPNEKSVLSKIPTKKFPRFLF